ncbi:toll/interleukin-1 receptor domain-containing protein [Pseudomonas sp. WS 5411]|uniref:toll/interleukin-1 receptor domain-containing protein n=1 Tax=Pseudomonas sp. WS 5411 TaxID=2717486 RepID=UPI001475F3E0|nr:toll/interleukin-1 receptor domain-containing protein [Pseudomonas sp. WS 5411]NMY84506.1 toll/interleukin-1 receptor domain-containing protein [Pseudomonas sp. WS 5411]
MKNAQSYFSGKFGSAFIISAVVTYPSSVVDDLQVGVLSLIDPTSGVKSRVLVLKNLGNVIELEHIVKSIDEIFLNCDGDLALEFSNEINRTGHAVHSETMTVASVLSIYTNKLCAPIEQVLSAFEVISQRVRVIEEAKMYMSLFVSYGGPDEEVAVKINKRIRASGVTTWFFLDDALPGQKLHRMMFDGVNQHDRVLLVCSKNSLSRSGVLNEIEKVLEREAKEGGGEILIPITLDDFVFSEWAPSRPDIAAQIRNRVITPIDTKNDELFEEQISKVLRAIGR